MSDPSLADYRWLVGAEGQSWIERAAEIEGGEVRRTQRLRRDLSAERTHLVLDQLELRRRARTKFARADQMFFTRRALEQATDEVIAWHKAARLPRDKAFLDLCCGIGGDLLAMAGRGQVTGVDRDESVAILAEANARVQGLTSVRLQVGDAGAAQVESVDAWHVDPDRRPDGRRTTRVELHEPNDATLDALLGRNDRAAFKLAPAATPPESWSERAELEWIGRDGECRQLLAWFGSLAESVGRRRATILKDIASPPRTIVGEPMLTSERSSSLGRYLYEPDSAVLAAELAGSLAVEHSLSAFEPGIAYLTGDACVMDDTALAGFEVLETLPFDEKRVRALLAERQVGRLEIKQRGTDIDPNKLRPKLRLSGDREATLIVTRHAGRTIAILARRLVLSEPSFYLD